MTLSTSSQEKTVVPEIQAGSGILEEPKEPEVPLAVEEDYEIVEPDHHDGPEDQAKETTQNADQILEVPEISNVSEEFAAELLPVLTVDKDGIKIASAGDVNGTIDPEEQHGTPEAKDTVIQAQDLEERPLIQGQKVHESEPLQDHSVTKTPVEDHPASEVKEPETAKEDHRELSEQVASGVQDDKADSTPSSESVHCDKAEESKSEDHLAKHDETIPITQDVSTPSESHNFTCNVETEQPNAEDELTKNDQTAAIAEDKVEDAAKVERKTSDVTQDTSESQEKNIPEENSEIAAVPELAVDTKENSVEPKREALECADSTTLQTSRCDVSACKPRAAEDHPAEAAAKHSADNEIQEVALDNTALEPEISAEASIPAIPNEHSTTEESKPIENDFISSIQETVEVIEPGEANLNSNETSEAEALETSETAENPDSNEATPAQPVSIPTIVIAESSPPPTAPQLASIQEESELQTTQVVAMSNSPTAPPRKLSPSNSPSSPSSPVAPPRRPSTIGVGGTMSRSASRATIIPKSTSSGSLTLNRAGSQGRLLFNTLPRNAHPPTRG